MRVDLATGGKDNDQMKRNDRERSHGNFNREPTDDRTLGEWRKSGSELPPPQSSGGSGGFRERGGIYLSLLSYFLCIIIISSNLSCFF